jgi:hypothetical protein
MNCVRPVEAHGETNKKYMFGYSVVPNVKRGRIDIDGELNAF